MQFLIALRQSLFNANVLPFVAPPSRAPPLLISSTHGVSESTRLKASA